MRLRAYFERLLVIRCYLHHHTGKSQVGRESSEDYLGGGKVGTIVGCKNYVVVLNTQLFCSKIELITPG